MLFQPIVYLIENYVYLKIACVYLSCQNVKMGSVFRNYALLVDQPWLQFVAAMKQG